MAVIKEVQQFLGLCRRRARLPPRGKAFCSAAALQCFKSRDKRCRWGRGGFISLLRASFLHLHSTTLPEKHFGRAVVVGAVTLKYTNVTSTTKVEMMIIISPTAHMLLTVERS